MITEMQLGRVYLIRTQTNELLFGVYEWILEDVGVGYIGGVFIEFKPGLFDVGKVRILRSWDAPLVYECGQDWRERVGITKLFA